MRTQCGARRRQGRNSPASPGTRPSGARVALTLAATGFCVSSGVFAQVSIEGRGERTEVASGGPSRSQSLDLQATAASIVDKTNRLRTEHGRDPLESAADLEEAAEYFADYMARTDEYGHMADGRQPSERAQQHGYEYCIVAENIATHNRSDAQSEQAAAEQWVQGWIDSPEHRDNMLDPAVTEIGVAAAYSEQSGFYYAVQMFGRPRSEAIEFTIRNEARRTIEYRLAGRTYSLPSGASRVHQECRPPELVLEGEAEESVQPKGGDQYVVVEGQDELSMQQR
jgi:uncharacterized protein YkwD